MLEQHAEMTIFDFAKDKLSRASHTALTLAAFWDTALLCCKRRNAIGPNSGKLANTDPYERVV